jgi:hypothetical protein
MDKGILKLLYRSFEEDLRPVEKTRLSGALEESKELRRLKNEIVFLRRAVGEGAARSFRPGFSDRVMARVEAPPPAENGAEQLSRAFQWVFRRFVVVALLVLTVLITYNLIHTKGISAGDVYYISDVSFGKILPLPLL